MNMNNIIKSIDRLCTVREDISKHIVGSMYCSWAILVAYGFFGKTVGIITALFFISLFILWEIYFMVKDKRPFSMTDVLAGIIPMTPFLFMLINTKN